MKTPEDTTETLVILRAATIDACKAAFNKRQEFKNVAINWGDLTCTEALHCGSHDGREFYQVVVEEAAPESRELCAFIEGYLAEHGFEAVECRCEW